MRRTPISVGSFSAASRGSPVKGAVTAIFRAVLDVLKMPCTPRFASSNACGAVIPPDQRMSIPQRARVREDAIDVVEREHARVVGRGPCLTQEASRRDAVRAVEQDQGRARPPCRIEPCARSVDGARRIDDVVVGDERRVDVEGGDGAPASHPPAHQLDDGPLFRQRQRNQTVLARREAVGPRRVQARPDGPRRRLDVEPMAVRQPDLPRSRGAQQRTGVCDLEDVQQRRQADARPRRRPQLAVDRHLRHPDAARDLEHLLDLPALLRALDAAVEDQEGGQPVHPDRADPPGAARGLERPHGDLERRRVLPGPEHQAHGERTRAAIGRVEERREGGAHAIDPRGGGAPVGDRELGQGLGVAGVRPHADVRGEEQSSGRHGGQGGILVGADRDLAGAGHALAVEDDARA